jgi:protein subunit release factor B
MFPVSKKKADELQKKLKQLGIREEDLEEQFVRSSGAGGQNVNKTSTCVLLHHLPSGIRVRCQSERSQALNRYRARKILAGRLEREIAGRESSEIRKIEKIRRQKRKRSRRAKEKILADKRIRSEVKGARRRVAREPNEAD